MASEKPNIVVIVASVVAMLAGYAAVEYVGVNRSSQFIGAGIAGALCGLLPFFIHRKKIPNYAKGSMAGCVVAGLVLGILLALPVAAILTGIGYAVARKKKVSGGASGGCPEKGMDAGGPEAQN